MAESIIAERNPPWTMPAGFKKRSSTRMRQTVVASARFSTHVRPSVRSQFGGIWRAIAKGYP